MRTAWGLPLACSSSQPLADPAVHAAAQEALGLGAALAWVLMRGGRRHTRASPAWLQPHAAASSLLARAQPAVAAAAAPVLLGMLEGGLPAVVRGGDEAPGGWHPAAVLPAMDACCAAARRLVQEQEEAAAAAAGTPLQPQLLRGEQGTLRVLGLATQLVAACAAAAEAFASALDAGAGVGPPGEDADAAAAAAAAVVSRRASCVTLSAELADELSELAAILGAAPGQSKVGPKTVGRG